MAIKDVISWFYGKSKAETGKGNAPTQTGAQPRVNLHGPSVTIDGPSNQRMGRISIDGRAVAGMPFRTSGEDDRLIGNYVLISKDEIERATHEAKKEDDKNNEGLEMKPSAKKWEVSNSKAVTTTAIALLIGLTVGASVGLGVVNSKQPNTPAQDSKFVYVVDKDGNAKIIVTDKNVIVEKTIEKLVEGETQFIRGELITSSTILDALGIDEAIRQVKQVENTTKRGVLTEKLDEDGLETGEYINVDQIAEEYKDRKERIENAQNIKDKKVIYSDLFRMKAELHDMMSQQGYQTLIEMRNPNHKAYGQPAQYGQAEILREDKYIDDVCAQHVQVCTDAATSNVYAHLSSAIDKIETDDMTPEEFDEHIDHLTEFADNYVAEADLGVKREEYVEPHNDESYMRHIESGVAMEPDECKERKEDTFREFFTPTIVNNAFDKVHEYTDQMMVEDNNFDGKSLKSFATDFVEDLGKEIQAINEANYKNKIEENNEVAEQTEHTAEGEQKDADAKQEDANAKQEAAENEQLQKADAFRVKFDKQAEFNVEKELER